MLRSNPGHLSEGRPEREHLNQDLHLLLFVIHGKSNLGEMRRQDADVIVLEMTQSGACGPAVWSFV